MLTGNNNGETASAKNLASSSTNSIKLLLVDGAKPEYGVKGWGAATVCALN